MMATVLFAHNAVALLTTPVLLARAKEKASAETHVALMVLLHATTVDLRIIFGAIVTPPTLLSILDLE